MERQVWTVNDKKVVEALREIFEKYGFGIVGEPIKFRSALYDLLDEWHYKDERVVFRIAIESNALLPFASDASITVDMATQMINQLKKNHMTEKDAQFVVQCILAARSDSIEAAASDRERSGGSDIVIDYKRQQEEGRRKAETSRKKESPILNTVSEEETTDVKLNKRTDTNLGKGMKYRVISAVLNGICIILLCVSLFNMADDGIWFWDALPFAAISAIVEIVYGCYSRYRKKRNGRELTKGSLIFRTILTLIPLLIIAWNLMFRGNGIF